MLAKLEACVSGRDDRDVADKVYAGFCLLCVSCRLRFSDGQSITKIDLDCPDLFSGYIEAEQNGGKTATTKEKKSAYLPVAGPVQGVIADSDWANAYLKLLYDEGFIDDYGYATRGHLLTAPLEEGGWSSRRVDSSELSAWLREFLRSEGFIESAVVKIASHSLKRTFLSYCAKFGVSHDSRRTLGYHVDPASTSMAIYSRDMLAKPLRDLDEVLESIRSHGFLPDASRSGYFPKKVQALTSSEDSSSDCSSAPTERQLEEVHAVLLGSEPKRPAATEGFHLYQHTRLGTLHAAKDGNWSKLACGRYIA